MQTSFNDWLAKRRQSAQLHRQLLVISGPRDWAETKAREFTERETALWFGEGSGDSYAIAQYRQLLGQECPNLIFNAYSGLRASAMMALSGTVQAGGLMVLLCPSFDDWPGYRDPELAKRLSYGFKADYQQSYFTHWLIHCIKQNADVVLLTPREFRGQLSEAKGAHQTIGRGKRYSPTAEQQKLVDWLTSSHHKRSVAPLLVSADRGRGKSSALGMAAGRLLQQARARIAVTAPHRQTVEPIFRFANYEFSNKTDFQNELKLTSDNGGELHFYPPDVLLREKPEIDWLLVDEAAALPAPMLMALNKLSAKTVYSSTIHGYEGSGRGFTIRFKPYLDENAPKWQQLTLNQPIRWLQDDPLEAFWFEVMMSRKQAEPTSSDDSPVVITSVSQNDLLNQPRLTSALFNLLVDAHYQTTPDDLMRLMDAPDARVYIAAKGQQLCGAVLIQQEGGAVLSELKQAIALGLRRLNGHLVAQNLAGYTANGDFAELSYWRVVRIAVDHEQRQQGIGTALLTRVEQDAEHNQVNALSVSFGAQSPLLRFWQQQGFGLARLGYRRDTASGEHNAIMLKPLTAEARHALTQAQTQFSQEYEALLPLVFNNLEASLGLTILQSLPHPFPRNWAVRQLAAFMAHSRPLEAMTAALKVYLPHWDSDDTVLPSLLFQLCYQCQDSQTLIARYGYAGKKHLIEALQQALMKQPKLGS